MAGIGEMEYGVASAGVENYIAEVKVNLLTTAADRLKDISEIRNICEQEWSGQSRDNFLSNLQKDIEHVVKQFSTLIETFEGEVNSVQNAMITKDQDLIKLD